MIGNPSRTIMEWPDLMHIGPYVLQTIWNSGRQRVQCANWSDATEVPTYWDSGPEAIRYAVEKCNQETRTEAFAKWPETGFSGLRAAREEVAQQA